MTPGQCPIALPFARRPSTCGSAFIRVKELKPRVLRVAQSRASYAGSRVIEGFSFLRLRNEPDVSASILVICVRKPQFLASSLL